MSVDASLVTLTKRSTKAPLLSGARANSGGLASTDLDRAYRFYNEVLGLPVERSGSDRVVVSSGHNHTYIVEEVDAIEPPMVVLNHNGLVVDPEQMSVDEAYDHLVAAKDEYSLGAIGRPSNQHGSYSFYFQDGDGNWWEIENQGPFDRPLRDLTGMPDMTVEEARRLVTEMSAGSPGHDEQGEDREEPASGSPEAGAGSDALLAVREISHGTLESYGLEASRRFYEEVLGLTVYQWTPVSIQIIDHGHMYVAVDAPNSKSTMTWQMRNRLTVESESDVDEAHRQMSGVSAEYGMRMIGDPRQSSDHYGFGLQDLDGNWWEVRCELSAAS